MATACRCGWKEEPPITMSRGRPRHSSSVASLFGLVVVAIVGASSAFVFPHSSLSSTSFAPGSGSSYAQSTLSHNIRNRGKIRPTRTGSTSLFVSLESPSTAPIESDELTDVAHNIGSSRPSNATMSDMSNDLPITVTSESVPLEVVIPLEETDEHHMERVRMGDDVEELTRLLAHDEVDLQRLLSPSIPISYDEHGMAQADATVFTPTVYPSNEISIEANGAMATVIANNEPDYPQFIKFLYQKDTNGQTLASKLFNFALLAASFGYVFVSVFYIDKGMTRGWSPGEIGMRIPLDTWASYENSLSEKPVATKTIINIVIYLLGDWLSQTLFQKKNVLDFDAARTLKNGFVGMCFGPVVHEYYEFSDWIFPVEGVTMGITNRAFKILMDQTVYLSIKCSIYIFAIGVLSGDSAKDSSENVKNRIKPIMFAAWKFWPLVHCVTYGLIPARHRILWVNSVDLVWNAILASKARDDDGGDDESMEALKGLDNEGGTLEANGERGFGMDTAQKISFLSKPGLSVGNLNEPSTAGGEEDALSDGKILGAPWEAESSDAKTLLVKD